LQQEHEEREDEEEDEVASIGGWDDLDHYLELERDIHDEETPVEEPPDPDAIDSPDERRRQIEGFKAEISFQWDEASKAERLLGRAALANFEAALAPLSVALASGANARPKYPEFTTTAARDNPHARRVQMNHMLGLEGSNIIFGDGEITS
jgi:hypothetical protein